MEIRNVDDLIGTIDSILKDEPMNLKTEDYVSVKTFDNYIEIRKIEIKEL